MALWSDGDSMMQDGYFEAAALFAVTCLNRQFSQRTGTWADVTAEACDGVNLALPLHLVLVAMVDPV